MYHGSYIPLNDRSSYVPTYGSTKVNNYSPDEWKLLEHKKIGRNDLCVCGSGKKFKKCCGTKESLPKGWVEVNNETSGIDVGKAELKIGDKVIGTVTNLKR
jgi:hypothetical protein